MRTLNNSVSLVIIFAICLTTIAQFFSAGIYAEEANRKSDVIQHQTGRLAILPEAPADVGGCLSKAYVFAEDKVVAKADVKFDAPILFDALPVSGNVRIEIVPLFGRKMGLAGKGEAVVKAGELTTIRITLKQLEASEYTIQILDPNGKPVSKHVVWFEEVTKEKGTEGCLLDTDDTGTLSEWVFPERKYRCVLKKSTPHEIQVFRSPLYELDPKKDDQKVVWRLEEPKTLAIRLIQKIDGKTIPMKQLSTLEVVPIGIPDAHGRGIDVKDGTIVLSKLGNVLQGASKARVYLASNMLPFQIANNLILIDDKAKQQVDVELVPIRDVKVAFRTDIAGAQAYLVRYGVKQAILKPGQAATVKSGHYRAIIWAPGYTVQDDEVAIDGQDVWSLSYEAKKASVVTAKAMDMQGNAITKGAVRGRYADIAPIPTQRVKLGKDGEFSMALDPSRKRLLAVVTDRGGQLISLAENESLKKNVLTFHPPCMVTGTVAREEQLVTGSFPGTNMQSRPVKDRIFLFDSTSHDLLLAEASVTEGGTFQLPVQPGKYDVVLFALGDGVVIRQIEVKEGTSKLDIGTVTVTKAMWKAAKGIPSHVK